MKRLRSTNTIPVANESAAALLTAWVQRAILSLKGKYLRCFHPRLTPTMRHTVEALVHLGVGRSDLLAWAVVHGHERKGASKLLSQILCPLGLRLRRAGAGRPSSPAGLFLQALACEMFGNRA